MSERRGWAASGVLGVDLDDWYGLGVALRRLFGLFLMEKHDILRRHGEGMNEHFARL